MHDDVVVFSSSSNMCSLTRKSARLNCSIHSHNRKLQRGGFVDSTHYDHYSLLRTIEESLGLPTLTNNDKYAVPMNGFWGPTTVV